MDVTLTAICGLDLPAGQSGKVICSADPLVGFDQAAFDAEFGSNSFLLSDYFRFVFSDGLAPPTRPVPEPSSLLLLLAGLLLLGVRWFRTQ